MDNLNKKRYQHLKNSDISILEKVAVSDDRESSKLQYRMVRTETVSCDMWVE